MSKATKTESAKTAKPAPSAGDQPDNPQLAPPKTKRPKKISNSSATPEEPAASRHSSTAWFALLVAVVAGAGTFKLWQQTQDIQQQLTARIENNNAALEGLNESLAALQSEAKALTSSVRERESEVDTALTDLRRVLQQDQSDWRLAEIEHLLRTANNLLLLGHDTKSAAQALAAADQRLAQLAQPRLLPVREQLAQEMQALKTATAVDVTGMLLALDGLAEQVEKLPLPAEPKELSSSITSEVPATDRWRAAADNLLASLKGVVSIRRRDTAVAPLLPPNQRFFLYQNLKLRLESAKLALLRGDGSAFGGHMTTSTKWVQHYFDQGSPHTKAVLQSLEALAAIDIDPELPDLSGSLAALLQLLDRSPGSASSPTSDSDTQE